MLNLTPQRWKASAKVEQNLITTKHATNFFLAKSENNTENTPDWHVDIAEYRKDNLKRRLKKQHFKLLLLSFFYKHWTLKGHLREKIREFTIKFGVFPLFFDDGASDSNYLKKICLSLQASNDQLLFLYGLVAPNYGLLPPNDSFFRANDSLPAANNRSRRATLAIV